MAANNGKASSHRRDRSSSSQSQGSCASSHSNTSRMDYLPNPTSSQTTFSTLGISDTSYEYILSSNAHTNRNEQDPPATLTLPHCMNSRNTWYFLRHASIDPPVTADTVKELDLQWIQNNINLRTDVHYETDLHFMPISGRRGEEKRLQAQRYWLSLEIELKLYQHDSSGPCSACAQARDASVTFVFVQRLPTMFKKLLALLLILVPSHDHPQVIEALEVDLRMQQITKGAFDAVKLSQWLSELLTTHCAPVRDQWARDMTLSIAEGVEQNNMASLVAGLEKLFSFCEAMKLDVANHQIRTFRLPLIEDGISFQRDYFQTRIRLGKLDMRSSLDWVHSVRQQCLLTNFSSSDYSIVIYGLVMLCVQTPEQIPELLKYDSGRIQQFREEVSDIIHLRICWAYLVAHTGLDRGAPLRQVFETRLLDLTDGEGGHDAGSPAVWRGCLDAISMEVARMAVTARQPQAEAIPAEIFARVRKQLGILFTTDSLSRVDGLASELRNKVLIYVNSFRTRSALQISELQQHYQQSRSNNTRGRHVPDLEDIARRLAHITIIHWEVWKDMAYME